MNDQEIIQGLISRDNRVTEEFFFDKCRPLFISVMKRVFDYEVEYNEMVNELYVYLMEDDAVSISLYRCLDIAEYREISVTIPQSESDVTVRVTLQAENSSFEMLALSYICSVDQNREQLIKLELPDSRKYICTIYADNAVLQRTEIGADDGQ